MSASASHPAAPPLDVSARLQRLRKLVRLLDTAFTIPGTKFRIGLDPIVGLIPGLGDAVTAAVSLYIVLEAHSLGAGRSAVVQMLINVAIDFFGGSIPILGDIFDAAWKCNVRNLRILERTLGRQQQ